MPDAGDIILAADFPAAVSDTQDTSGTTTSTTYTATLTGGVACGVVFVAPTSGRVTVLNSSRIINNGANATYCGFSLRTGGTIGSGTVVMAEGDNRAIGHEQATNTLDRMTVSQLVTGLTPGATYNVQQLFRAVAGTGSFANKHLSVIPTT